MRPSEFVAIRPHLERATREIDADFTRRKQSLEIAKELEEEFNRLAALPKGTPSKTKLKTIPRKQYKQVVRSMLGPPTKQKGAMQQYRIREKLLMRHPRITRPLIEHGYPWRHAAARAARELYDCGWTKEAEAITEVLSGLPTGPVDGKQPDVLERQLDAIREAAERIRTILTTCLAGANVQESTADDANTVLSGKGVSLLDAALILTEEDRPLAREKKSAWQKIRTPRLPASIGNCPNHKQVKLFAPSAMADFVEKVEGKPFCTQYKLRQRLNAKARAPRQE